MKTKLAILILTLFLLFSCATTKSTLDDKLKKQLIGTWSGSEEDNQKQGLTKYWIQYRNKNGTFTYLFTVIKNCDVESHIEKGKWWVNEGVFYEKYDVDGKTDSYLVKLLDDNNIKFKAKELSLEFDNKEYEFTETRQE